MANKILIKSKINAAGAPAVDDATLAEIALNTFDGKLYAGTNLGADDIAVGADSKEVSWVGAPIQAAGDLDNAFAERSDTKLATSQAIYDYVNSVTGLGSSVDLASEVTGTLPVTNGGTGAATLTNGGILLGSGDGAITAMPILADGAMIVGDGSTDPIAESGGTLRASIGLGDLATEDTINNGDWSGTDLTVANGGTGASTASGARTALGVAIGSDVMAYDATMLVDGDIGGSVQAQDAVLDDLSALDVIADNEVMVGTGAGTYANESGDTLRTSLGLAIGSDVQAYDAQLADVAGLAVTNGGFIVGNGSNFVLESGSTARNSLSLGTGNSPTFTNLTLSGNLDVAGALTDINTTDVTVEDNQIYLGVPGGMVKDAVAWARSSSTITVTSGAHGFATGEEILVLGAGNAAVPDGVYTITVSDAGEFTFTTSDTGAASGTLYHSKDDLTDSTETDSGMFVPGTAMHYVKFNSSNLWEFSEGIDAPSLVLDTALAVAEGGTGATSASAARTALGVAIGSDVQAYDAQLADVAGLAVTDSGFIVGNGSNFVLESGSTARTSLGLGTGAVLDTAAIADAGTGLATADQIHTFVTGLGYSTTDGTVTSIAAGDGFSFTTITGSGTIAVDGHLQDLDALGAVSSTVDQFMVSTGAGAWAYETPSSVRSTLGLVIGTNVQAEDAVLTDLSALSAVAENEFIVGTGAGTYAHESGSTARTSMGLGTAAVMAGPAGTIVGHDDEQTLSNKTIANPTFTTTTFEGGTY